MPNFIPIIKIPQKHNEYCHGSGIFKKHVMGKLTKNYRYVDRSKKDWRGETKIIVLALANFSPLRNVVGWRRKEHDHSWSVGARRIPGTASSLWGRQPPFCVCTKVQAWETQLGRVHALSTYECQDDERTSGAPDFAHSNAGKVVLVEKSGFSSWKSWGQVRLWSSLEDLG